MSKSLNQIHSLQKLASWMRDLWLSSITSIDRFWWRGSGPVLCPRFLFFEFDQFLHRIRSWRSDLRRISFWISLIAFLHRIVGLAHTAARVAEKCIERWCNAFDIQFRIFQDFLMWLERLFIMKTSTNCIRAYSALLHISYMIARCM